MSIFLTFELLKNTKIFKKKYGFGVFYFKLEEDY